MELEKEFLGDGTVAVRFPSGKRTVIQQVSALQIQTIQTSTKDKPDAPWVEFEVRGHRKRERNPDDPAYKEAVTKWEAERSTRLMQFIIGKGVVPDPDADYLDEVEDLIDTNNPIEVKMMWVGSLFSNPEVEALAAAITALTLATEEGIDEASETFPGDDERD